MSLDALLTGTPLVRRPKRLQRSRTLPAGALDVGPGTKWSTPIKPHDVKALLSSEPDIAAAYKKGGWRAGALLLYHDYLLEEGLDPTELQGKDLVCTCKLDSPCHADVLIELANQ